MIMASAVISTGEAAPDQIRDERLEECDIVRGAAVLLEGLHELRRFFSRREVVPAIGPSIGKHRDESGLWRQPPEIRLRLARAGATRPVQHDHGRTWSRRGRPLEHECARLPVDDELHRLGRNSSAGRYDDEGGTDECANETVHGCLPPKRSPGNIIPTCRRNKRAKPYLTVAAANPGDEFVGAGGGISAAQTECLARGATIRKLCVTE
jgi:hypothetical protein